MVRLYSKQGCPPCVQLKQYLKIKNVNYEEFDISSPEFAKVAGENNLRMVPILEVDDIVISGYNPSRLNEVLSL